MKCGSLRNPRRRSEPGYPYVDTETRMTIITATPISLNSYLDAGRAAPDGVNITAAAQQAAWQAFWIRTGDQFPAPRAGCLRRPGEADPAPHRHHNTVSSSTPVGAWRAAIALFPGSYVRPCRFRWLPVYAVQIPPAITCLGEMPAAYARRAKPTDSARHVRR